MENIPMLNAGFLFFTSLSSGRNSSVVSPSETGKMTEVWTLSLSPIEDHELSQIMEQRSRIKRSKKVWGRLSRLSLFGQEY